MIKSNDPSSLIDLLENTQTKKGNQMEFRTEYTDNFNKEGNGTVEK
jgi:hypothetical protein